MKKIPKNIIIGIAVVILIVIGILINKKKEQYIIPEDKLGPQIPSKQIVVDVKGEVYRPGLYCLDSEARVYDAIIQAGGFTNNAQIETLNMALKLSDGMVIYVERKSQISHTQISINNASLDELMKISGIGEAKARNIIKYREEHGRFYTLEDLKNVSGISENLFQQIKEFICL